MSETIEKYEPGENARAYLRALIADAEGRRSEADELLATARARFGDSPFQLASFYAGRGDAEQTLNWAGKFVESYPGSAPIVLSNNSFSFVFDTPEWQEWRRQFNMHPDQLAEIEFDIPDFN